MSRKIWVYAETDQGRVVDVVYELLAKAAELAQGLGGASVEAVLLGDGIESLVPELTGAETVHLAQDPRLTMWSPLTFVPILAGLVKKHDPDIFLFGATAQGGTLGSALAAHLRTGMAAHCVELRIDEGMLVSSVPAFGGKVIGEILCTRTRPQMASVKPGIFVRAAEAYFGETAVVTADVSCLERLDTSALRPLEVRREKVSGVPLNKAEFVACGGFGVGGKENWLLLEELAVLMGGAVACTRPPVDEGWAQESSMVGTSGRSVRPSFYMGFGISGATHHICGMSDAGYVVSVNSDPDAPIFDVSDVKVVADAGVILSSLVDILKNRD